VLSILPCFDKTGYAPSWTFLSFLYICVQGDGTFRMVPKILQNFTFLKVLFLEKPAKRQGKKRMLRDKTGYQPQFLVKPTKSHSVIPDEMHEKQRTHTGYAPPTHAQNGLFALRPTTSHADPPTY
jgi:hypothetical protein